MILALLGLDEAARGTRSEKLKEEGPRKWNGEDPAKIVRE